jgi:hypothetical protein
MASLNDFPVDDVARFIHSVVNRGKMRDGSFASIHQCELTIEQVRMIWAAALWLDFYDDWGVGIEQTRFRLKECKAFIDGIKSAAKEDMKLFLGRRELQIMSDAARHLDHLAILKEEDSQPRNNKRRSKR